VDKKVAEAISLIESWYEDSLPSSFGVNLSLYAVRGAELARVVERKAVLTVDRNAPTAYSDKNSVVLPVAYFLREFYEKVVCLTDLEEREAVAVALALVNGSQIHEALHIKHDFPGRFDYIIGALKDVKLREKATSLIKNRRFVSILNTVFDLANEAWCKKQFTGLYTFLVAKNKVLFNDNAYSQAIEMYRETMDPSLILVLLKHDGWTEPLSHEPGLKELVEMVELARDAALAGDHEGEIELALRVFELMKSEEKEESEGEGDGGGEKSEGGKSNGKSGPSDSDETGPSTVIDYDMSEEEKAAIAKFVEENKEEAREEHDALLKTIIEEKASEAHKKALEVEYRSILSERRKDSSFTSDTMLSEVKSYRNLGTFFRRMREERHVPGQPRMRGTRIVKRELHRIVTDQKVMAYPDSSAIHYGKPEVALLIDSSGSMMGIYSRIVDHAYSIFKEFVNAGIPVSAYAHTSISGTTATGIGPVVYGIAAFQLPLGRGNHPEVSGNVKTRFGKTKTLSLQENFDGYAIDYVSRLFTSRSGSKVLIVLSDGLPQGGSVYSGVSAINHTKRMIEEARKRGVIVLAVSLTNSVKPANDDIYGKDYNLPAYDSTLLDKALSKVISWVALAHKGE
jgi:hypothetical protein